MTQCEAVLAYLKEHHQITAKDAIEKCNCYRLARALGCSIEYLIGVADLYSILSVETAAENRHLRNQMVKIRAELQGVCEMIRKDLIKD